VGATRIVEEEEDAVSGLEHGPCRLSYHTNMELKSSEGCCREESVDSDGYNDDDLEVIWTLSRKLEVAVKMKELSRQCRGKKLLLRKGIRRQRAEKNVF
jgi:hypothetical protein